MSRVELHKIATSDFQRMVRALSGAMDGVVLCYVESEARICGVAAPVGWVACATCGRLYRWEGTNEVDSGHCVPGRRASVVFEKTNCSPQCKYCNRHRDGQQHIFREVVAARHGKQELDRLDTRKRSSSVTFSTEEYVAMIKEYRKETRAAIKLMEESGV